MGLSEQLREGAILKRQTIQFSGSGALSASFGSAYILLAIEVDRPCRIRIYDDLASRNNSQETSRAYGVTPNNDISLVADIIITSPGRYTMDPVLYGVPRTSPDYFTFLRITENTGNVNGSVFVYNLEDSTIQADVSNRFYKFDNRRILEFTIGQNKIVAPRTFLMLTASTTHTCRLRLYSNEESRDFISEIGRIPPPEPQIFPRSFDEAIMTSDTLLISDMELTPNTIFRFFPKIIGFNVNRVPNNLEVIRTDRVGIDSFSEIYYTLESNNQNAKVTMNIFSLED